MHSNNNKRPDYYYHTFSAAFSWCFAELLRPKEIQKFGSTCHDVNIRQKPVEWYEERHILVVFLDNLCRDVCHKKRRRIQLSVGNRQLDYMMMVQTSKENAELCRATPRPKGVGTRNKRAKMKEIRNPKLRE